MNSKSILIRHLPLNQRSAHDVRENINSMEFLQALNTLDSLVWSEEFKSICVSFGIFDQEIFDKSKDRKIKSC